jgi:EAL domain-containing protein (putative c-di-GMP-specific phosphodiesterase class I)
VPVAVNLSGAQFKRKDFLESVMSALDVSGMDPRYLDLELTESIVMGDASATVSLLRSLKDLGVRISIDDFGTGYSSLSHLRRFPIDTLKIDQSFMRDLDAGEDDAAAITSAIISMAKSLRQRVIAEGVESREQVEFLQIRGCDAMQGYYYKPPLSAEEFSQLLQ